MKSTRSPLNVRQEIIFVVGGPGSGKGTHCANLVEKMGYHHISTGDLVRNIIKDDAEQHDNPDINRIRETIKSGELLDDQMIMDILKNEIQQHPRVAGFLIDGCPRTIAQLKMFEEQIKACNKVLYFDTTEEIMKQRILKRGLIEGREDDNEETAGKRIKVYRERTLPVVEELKKQKGAVFHHIDSSGTIEEVSQLVNSIVKAKPVEVISYFEFLKCYLTSRSFYAAIDQLEKTHGGAADFKIMLGWVTMFYVIQNREDVKRLLAGNTTTGYQNNNFQMAAGHFLNINAVQAFTENGEKNPIWEGIHVGLARSVGSSELIHKLINKHIPALFAKREFMLDVEFENFMLNFWCEYLFGNKVNIEEYKATRTKMLAALSYSFYGNKLKSLPFIGNLSCRFYGYMKQNEFAEVDSELQSYIDQAGDGLISRFKQELERNENFPKDKIAQAVLDNVFDFVLVYDFIANALYETLAEIVRRDIDSSSQRKRTFMQGLSNSFLFQYRVRVPQNDINLESTTVTAGVPTYINLLKSGLYHSYGPRACIGVGVTDWIKDAVWKYIEGMQLRVINTTHPAEREALSHNLDVPISPERYEVRWQFPKNYLQQVLPHYNFKGVNKFYDVLKIYENPLLFTYITDSFINTIQKQNLDISNVCIVTPEVRGISAASVVAHALKVPLVTIRKPGKIPGPIFSETYNSAYASDELQISCTSDVKGRLVVFIDDGIASGGTTMSCIKLVEKMQGTVCLVLAMINHTYKEKPAELANYTVQTIFEFSKDKVLVPAANDSAAAVESPKMKA